MPKHKKLAVKYEICKKRGKIKTTKHINLLALYSLSIYLNTLPFLSLLQYLICNKKLKVIINDLKNHWTYFKKEIFKIP